MGQNDEAGESQFWLPKLYKIVLHFGFEIPLSLDLGGSVRTVSGFYRTLFLLSGSSEVARSKSIDRTITKLGADYPEILPANIKVIELESIEYASIFSDFPFRDYGLIFYEN